MTVPPQRTIELMIKQFSGEITQAEQEELDGIIAQASPAQQQWYRDMLDPLQQAEAMAFAEAEDLAQYQQRWETNAHQQQKAQSRHRLRTGLQWTAAALLVIAAGTGIWQWTQRKPPQVTVIAGITADGESFFQLPNGEKIKLGSLNGQTISRGNVSLSRQNDELICHTIYTEGATPESFRLFVKNTQYTLTLNDSSKITLGNGSALHFSGHRNSKERITEISGAGYFDMKHRRTDTDTARVFIVADALETQPQRLAEVQAFGTRFDIRAYANDPEIRVTLEEGSLRVCKNTAQVQLLPGEEASFTRMSVPVKRKTARPGEASAWREGRILFTDTDVRTIMHDLERHYRISVSVADDVAHEKISLHSYYSRTIDYLVDIMKRSNSNIQITFRPGGDTIYVTKPAVRH